jgi:hypothetical protein
MKTLFFPIVLGFSIQMSTAQTGNITLPEMQVLYRNYPNKIIPNVPCGQTPDLVVNGATAQKASWTDQFGQIQEGYNLLVQPTVRTVQIQINGLDANGALVSSAQQAFQVKAFPAASILNGKISKTTGMRVGVGFGPDCPFTGVAFEVIGGSIGANNEYTFFNGDVIPASAVSKTKVGQNVVIEVSYKRTGSSEINVAFAVLEVTP